MDEPDQTPKPQQETKITRPEPRVRHPLLTSWPRWYEVRGYDGRLLFRFCPSALMIEIVVRGEKYPLVDLMKYIEMDAEVEKRFYTLADDSPDSD